MSFLIDDILSNTKNAFTQKDANKTSISNDSNNNKFPSSKKLEERNLMDCSLSEQNSILHQTLVNRLNSPYYRGSESHHGNPIENYQHCCYDPAYLNYYRSFYERDYSTLHRQKSWPGYDPTQANYFAYSMQYKYMYSPSKRKGGQVRFSANQTDILEKRFSSNKYLSPEERKVLADSLSLSDRQVKTWFQNRRAKWRRSNCTGEPIQDNSIIDETQIK